MDRKIRDQKTMDDTKSLMEVQTEIIFLIKNEENKNIKIKKQETFSLGLIYLLCELDTKIIPIGYNPEAEDYNNKYLPLPYIFDEFEFQPGYLKLNYEGRDRFSYDELHHIEIYMNYNNEPKVELHLH